MSLGYQGVFPGVGGLWEKGDRKIEDVGEDFMQSRNNKIGNCTGLCM